MTSNPVVLNRPAYLTRENVRLLEYKDTSFLYIISNGKGVELYPVTAFLVDQFLNQTGNTININPECYSRYRLEEINQAYTRLLALDDAIQASIQNMIQDQQLFKAMAEDVKDLPKLIEAQKNSHKEYFVYFARRCNLSCSYCWNEGGLLGEENPLEPTPEHLKGVVDFIVNNSGTQKKHKIIVYGGEPFLNLKGLKTFAQYAAQRGEQKGLEFEYLIDTNGTLWNHEIEKLSKEYNFEIMVSIDGKAESHDAYRHFQNGKPSHAIIVKNIKRMLKALPGRIGARAVLADPGASMKDTFEFFREFGFKEIIVFYNFFSGYIGGKHNEVLSLDTISQYKKELSEEVDNIIDQANSGVIPQMDSLFLTEMNFRKVGKRKLCRCVLGLTQLAFQSDGRIFPCVYFNEDQYCIGDVKDGQISNWEPIQSLVTSNVFNQPKCQDCWVRFSCGGCCIARSLAAYGKEDEPIAIQCERTKEEVKAYLYLNAKIGGMGPDAFTKLMKSSKGPISL